MRKSSQIRQAAAVLVASVVCMPAVVLACPTCKDAVAGDPVATALSATTLLLLGTPVVLIGSIGGWVGYVYWRAARRPARTGDAAPQPSAIASQPV